jgi:signal transduction histidine kinase/ActR/RegA family two-component response regulator
MKLYQTFVSIFAPLLAAFVIAISCICFFYVFPSITFEIEQNMYAALDTNIHRMLYEFRAYDSDSALDVKELERFVNGVKIRKTGYLALLNEDGFFIPIEGCGKVEFLQLSVSITNRNEGTTDFKTGGVLYSVFYKTVPSLHYKMVIFIKKSELYAPFSIFSAILALSLLLTVTTGFFFMRKLRAYYDGVFKTINTFAEEVASGNLHKRLNSGTCEEFSVFAANMNIMTENMEKMASEPGRDFLSRMSHEIRTPINAIVGMAAIAEKTENMAKIKDCLTKIVDGSAHLIGIVNDILDFSKLEAGKLILNEEAFILSEDLEFIDSMFKARTAEKNLRFSVTVSNVEHDCLVTDKLRLNQVLINLLSNAVKFTPPNGSIEVTAEEIFHQEGEGVYRFSVKDSGIGIEPHQAKKLFTPFTQANEKISSSYGGTGLGLVISKNIVQLMGGDIDLDTYPGKGTTFYFTIKVKAEVATVARESQEFDTIPDFSGKRLLIVDDVDINREICLELFQETGADMETAADGQEAFEKFFNNVEYYYDMILMDMRMPVLDGCEATKKIRNCAKKDARTVFIVAMTANVLAEEIKQAQNAGMNAHIAKPLNMADALKVMRNLFGG